MSNLADKDIPSIEAVPKAQNKKKRSSKNKNRYRDMERGTSSNVHPVEGLPIGDQGAVPVESPTQETRCKKRNKSVSFALDGEGTSKRSKYDAAAKKHESRIFKNSLRKKLSKDRMLKDGEVRVNDEMNASSSTNKPAASKIQKFAAPTKAEEKMDTTNEEPVENPPLKRKKPKRSKKRSAAQMATINQARPEIQNNSIPEDVLTTELDNFHIAPDQNNLADLLDDMVPASSKVKKKTSGHKLPKPAAQTDINSNVSNEFNLKKVVKWTKKRWNKDKKGVSIVSTQLTSVVVQNLPMGVSSLYQKKLTDIFEKHGRIKRIGPAEMGPETDEERVFSTTIYFETEEAATKALQEDNICFCGSTIRVTRPLPPTATTAVARCYNQLPLEELRAIFGGAGPLRTVRAGPRRGSGRMAVAFLEFDGPEAVQRALALSGTAKINGKPIYVNKFEARDNNPALRSGKKDQRPGKDKSASPPSSV